MCHSKNHLGRWHPSLCYTNQSSRRFGRKCLPNGAGYLDYGVGSTPLGSGDSARPWYQTSMMHTSSGLRYFRVAPTEISRCSITCGIFRRVTLFRATHFLAVTAWRNRGNPVRKGPLQSLHKIQCSQALRVLCQILLFISPLHHVPCSPRAYTPPHPRAVPLN